MGYIQSIEKNIKYYLFNITFFNLTAPYQI